MTPHPQDELIEELASDLGVTADELVKFAYESVGIQGAINNIQQGYTICTDCKRFAYITDAKQLAELPIDHDGELCQRCNLWMCAVDKLQIVVDGL